MMHLAQWGGAGVSAHRQRRQSQQLGKYVGSSLARLAEIQTVAVTLLSLKTFVILPPAKI